MCHRNLFYHIAVISFTGIITISVAAQQKPDSGHTIQELNKSSFFPKTRLMQSITEPVKQEITAPGGTVVQIKTIVVSGNSIFSDEELLSLLDIKGKTLDFSAIHNLADTITAFYHAHDYPFTRAVIPAQTLTDGKLQIKIIEGRYGDIFISNNEINTNYIEAAQQYLSLLKSGNIIKGSELENICLILDDQPGYKVTPVIRPGDKIGSGDLIVNMSPETPHGGSVRIDNHGNRYTGSGRVEVKGYLNSPLTFGDKFDTTIIYTEEKMWFGSVSYSLPILHSGLRGNMGFQHTDYQLGKEFSSLDAHGTADIISTGLSYPLIRSQQKNLSLFTTYQRKWLVDEQRITSTKAKKSSDTITTALNFDYRDTLWGGGVTYGSLSWTHGLLDLDDNLYTIDNLTAHTQGVFDKINWDIRRLQTLPTQKLSLFTRIVGQKAFENLDSSEDFGLGGPSAVRAYPAGESYGDEGMLGQIELRYIYKNNINPYIFYDYGHIKTNHTAWTTQDNDRTIGGIGLGLRATYKKLNIDTAAAWRAIGGPPQSDSRITTPTFWLNISYSF
ncbi:ShlB/FhaC/HecB family hemolysin secretion/activation protein [Vibrio hepatarius]|uniref:ShlB/FhaC/HecB family hemolysin secretion/activation protein n=1 Tax=Vibrio hepatarius TaxID=171383 RepID=UPI001C08D009|nr:ShlB/FhaC/HecB family hemolysin secretion/activation protein [Vibrio hepatarius]MBU2896760.1 ShlB/FhaC/HecB family hemolysin secretion/activation protein [Vibrio hepatarius]